MVLITLLTPNKKHYKVDVQNEASINQVKNLAAETIGNLDEKSIKLLYKGKILENETTINSLNMKEKDFIVVYCENKKSMISVQKENANQNVQLSSSDEQIQVNPQNQNNENKSIDDDPEFINKQNQLIEITGFSHEKCEEALRSSNGNIEEAADMLFNQDTIRQIHERINDIRERINGITERINEVNGNQMQNNQSFTQVNQQQPNQFQNLQYQRQNYRWLQIPQQQNQYIQYQYQQPQYQLFQPQQYQNLQYLQTHNQQIQQQNPYQYQPNQYQQNPYQYQPNQFQQNQYQYLQQQLSQYQHQQNQYLQSQSPQYQFPQNQQAQPQPQQQIPTGHSGSFNENTLNFLRHAILIEPRMLENVIELIETQKPIFRSNPENFLLSIGLPLLGFDLDGIRNRTVLPLNSNEITSVLNRVVQQMTNQSTENNQQHPSMEEELWLSQFSSEEKNAIRRIQRMGEFDLGEVVQVYMACDKDEQMALSILRSE